MLPVKLVDSSWYLVVRVFLTLFILTTYYLLLATPTFAQTTDACNNQCDSSEVCNAETKTCENRIGAPTATPNPTPDACNNACDSSEVCDEETKACKSVIGAPTVTPTPRPPERPSASNWDAAKQAAFTGNGIINMFSCFGAEIPFGTDGCPTVFFTNQGPQTLITYNGEGGGALGASSHLMAQMYQNQPASGVQYMARVIQDGFSGAQPAYAQVAGTGRLVVGPVEKIWQVSRNIAYLLFTLIFVVTGFMIMLRQKLNPQTVISVQAALPGLVIGLILVTFSFFISGLIIDLAFVLSQVIGVVFLNYIGNDPNSAANVRDLLNRENAVTMFSRFIFSGDLLGTASNIGSPIFDAIAQNPANRVIISILGILGACLSPLALGAAVPSGGLSLAACAAIGGAGGAVGGNAVVSGIVYLVLLFGLLQAMFRLLFSLISAYVGIVLSTIFSPFIILYSSLPGQGGNLALWWRGLLANVLVFPAVFGAFLLVAAILGVGDQWHLENSLTGEFEQALPLFGGSPVGFVKGLLTYGILLALPGIPDLVKSLLKAQPNQIIDRAVNRGIQGGVGMTQTAGAVAPTVIQGARPTILRVWRTFFP